MVYALSMEKLGRRTTYLLEGDTHTHTHTHARARIKTHTGGELGGEQIRFWSGVSAS